jgi:hypothetical protein
VHHDTASARSWVQLRVRVVACTAVDDPPPKQDDGRKLAGDLDGSCQAPDLTLCIAPRLTAPTRQPWTHPSPFPDSASHTVSQPAATTIHCEEPVVSRVANARSYADADLEHDGGADHRRARRRSDERQYPRFADRRNWNTDPHPPRPPCRLPPAPRARTCARRNCKVNLDDMRGIVHI